MNFMCSNVCFKIYYFTTRGPSADFILCFRVKWGQRAREDSQVNQETKEQRLENCTVSIVSSNTNTVQNSLLCALLLLMLLTFSSLNRETMGCQDPGDHQVQQESQGEMYVTN